MHSPLHRFKEIWVVDFEFRVLDGERPSPVCLVAWELRSNRKLRLWHNEFASVPPYSIGPDALFVCYMAAAELSCHLVLDWPRPAFVLDLYVEYKNLTNGDLTFAGLSLLGALAAFGLSGITSAEKDSMREVVIRGGPWSREERNAILGYCETDVRGLAELLPKMVPLINLPQAVHRGRYMHAVACMEYFGVPIDVETLTVLQERWTDIQDALIAKIDSAYHVFEGRTFKLQKFTEYLIRNNISWPGQKSGQLDLSDGAFKDRSRVYPALLNLRYLRNALSKMRLNDLTVGHDGFNRSGLRPFKSRTGRNQPSNSKFIFGAASWLRSLIKPPRGYGLCYIDWVQQEFAIAAALSGDAAMIMAYESGDSYLWFAKETGDVPPDATRKTHGAKRERFKQCVLGTQYGIGEEALADRIGQSIKMGRHLLRLHRETFRRYWEWVDGALNTAFLTTSQATVYGWTEKITEANCNPRAIANFFCQANGAEMLRLACCFGIERGIQICAPVHDAVLIMAPLDRLEADIAVMRECMEQASALVLAGFKLRTNTQTIRFPERYVSEKGNEMWQTVMEIL